MVEHERKIASSAALAIVRRRRGSADAGPSLAWPRKTPRRSRLCSLPAHGFGARSRQRPARTATFGQFGAPQTLAARRTPTSSTAGWRCAELASRAVRAEDDRLDRLRVVGVVDGHVSPPAALTFRLLTAALGARQPLPLLTVLARWASSSTTKIGAWSASSSRMLTTCSVRSGRAGSCRRDSTRERSFRMTGARRVSRRAVRA
jgi:hypothetical protein